MYAFVTDIYQTFEACDQSVKQNQFASNSTRYTYVLHIHVYLGGGGRGQPELGWDLT